MPAAAQMKPSLAEWAPGRMRITLAGRDPRQTYLIVSENWYPDWHAEVDGKPVAVLRGDYALLSVVLPPGAREVRFHFASAAYTRGKLVTALALLLALGLMLHPLWSRRKAADA